MTLSPPQLNAGTRKHRDTAAVEATRRVLSEIFGPAEGRHFAVRYWDGTEDEPLTHPAFTLVLRHPGALRRLLLPPNEVSIAESYLYGDVDVEGDMEAAANLGDVVAQRAQGPAQLARLARHVVALPAARRRGAVKDRSARWLLRFGRRHSARRDSEAVRFHYDVGNDFFALWLDRRMVYSCAYFQRADEDLDSAQEAKLDYVCRKLRLQAGERLLDVGCGWGSLLMHAAQYYGVEAVGITLSERQAALGRERIAAAGLASRCRIELRDYRTLGEGTPFDKIASIGMVEHVGSSRLSDYFAAVFRALKPGGLFLNHGIVTIAGTRARSIGTRVAGWFWGRSVFISRYVFPDGELLPEGQIVAAGERAGFELRDVESLREHYALTLRHWVRNLEREKRKVVDLVGEFSYRVWRLYMSGSAYAFRTGRIGVQQSLFARPDETGHVPLPLTRDELYGGGGGARVS